MLSTLASPGFVAGPAVAWVAVLGAALLLPLGPLGTSLSFRGDVILLVYLLALARFCTAWAALETGSAFEGMGAAREVSYAVLAEAAVITAVLTLSLQSGSVGLGTMLASSAGTGAVLLAAGLFTVLLAENCRVPFDDPNTHLELTMIHEVMVLDHSGPPLAVVLHGASMKLLLFAVLLVAGGAAGRGTGRRAAAAAALIAGVVLVGRGGRAGGIVAGALRVPPRAAAADDGVSAVSVRAAGGLEGRLRVNDESESADWRWRWA